MVNKKYFFAIFTLTLLLIFACKPEKSELVEPPPPPPPPPTADFSFSVVTQPLQSAVTFTNNSTNANNYTWDFGDGTTDTATNPVHYYQTGGTFKVKLTAKGSGEPAIAEKEVTVLKPITTCVLKKINFTGFYPSKWFDNDSDPDIYVIITNGSSILSSRTASQYKNVPLNTQLSWTFTNKYTITPLTNKIKIAFWDADDTGDSDDLIEEFDFLPKNHTSGSNAFPSVVSYNYTYGAGDIEIAWE